MKDGAYGSTSTTAFISAGIVLVIVLIGVITFGIAEELKKSRQLAGLLVSEDFDPDSLPAPAAGNIKRKSGNPIGCEGMLFSAAINGTRYVRESGGGRYYAAEVDNAFELYTLSYDQLVKIDKSSLDTHTYRKLRYALYHCEGQMTESGLRIANASPDGPQV